MGPAFSTASDIRYLFRRPFLVQQAVRLLSLFCKGIAQRRVEVILICFYKAVVQRCEWFPLYR